MIAYGRCPYVVAMLGFLAPVEVSVLIFGQYRIVIEQGRADDFPVYEVGTVENLKSWKALEGRGSHVIIISHPANVRVGIISIDDRIAVHTAFDVRVPRLGRLLRIGFEGETCDGESHCGEWDCEFFDHDDSQL